MILSKSKICTVVSVVLLMISMAFASFFWDSSTKYNSELFTLIMFCCWLTGGGSLIFSTQISFKFFKWAVIVLNWICIYSWFLFSR